MPAVSVVIPVHNRAHLVRHALQSVLQQAFTDFEVVVVDDGSTDNLSSVVQSFADSRVRIVSHAERMGGAAARNTGIEHSHAELVAFLDSDDEWTDDKLASQVRALNSARATGRPQIVVSASRRDWQSAAASVEERWMARSGRDINLGLLGATAVGIKVQWCTMLAPREELKKIGGFDPGLPATHWWDLVFRLTERCDFLLGAGKVLICHDPQGDRVRQLANVGRAAEILLTKHDMTLPEAKVTRSHMLTASAMYRMAQGEYLNPLKSLLAAFIARPGLRPAVRIGGALLGGRAFFRLQGLLGRRSTGARYGVDAVSTGR
jgi:glycosyltransferase involved in cell wall biosynthesis